MYILINQENRIIAASSDLLKEIGVDTIYEFSRMQDENEIVLDVKQNQITVEDQNSTFTGTINEVPSLFGTLLLGSLREKGHTKALSEIESLEALEEETDEVISLEPVPEEKTVQEEEHSLNLKEETSPELEDLLDLNEEVPLTQVVTDSEEKLTTSESLSIESTDEEPPLQEETEEPSVEPNPDLTLDLVSEESFPEKEPSQEITTTPEIETLLELTEESSEAESVEEEKKGEEKHYEEDEAFLDSLFREEEELQAPQTETPSGELTETLPKETEEHPPSEEENAPTASKEMSGQGSRPPEKENFVEENNTTETKEEKAVEVIGKEILGTFYPDIENNAARIELTSLEYKDLLREFITESRELRQDLLSEDPKLRHRTIASLKDASTLLQLNPLPEFLTLLEKSETSQRSMMVDALYEAINRLEDRIAIPEEAEIKQKIRPEEETQPEKPAPTESIATPEAETVSIVTPTEAEVSEPKPSISTGDEAETFLRDVKIVPIEFSLKIAAEDLNLPEDLVLEFINDFATQGHEYLPVLIDAYKNGDLTKLQETAHMLKGAASNLRIEPMVENLYELQFDNDIERAPKRIRLFAGQLMSLDKYLSQMNAS